MKRGGKPDKEAMKTDMTACADQFLATKYATCNAMMKTGDAEKKEVMGCYIKVSVVTNSILTKFSNRMYPCIKNVLNTHDLNGILNNT